MLIRYLYNSGFALECGRATLLIDVWPQSKDGEGGIGSGEVDGDYLKSRPGPIYLLVSHGHHDHFNRSVLHWRKLRPDIRCILSSDIKLMDKKGVSFLSPGTEYRDENLFIRAFGSTDLGVSLYLEAGGLKLFHAGDLNNWHWREESTPREIEEAERDFQQVMETMRGEKVDVAFFPVDPRLGMMFDAGPNYFAMVVKPRLMIPMHFWERAEVIREYARRSRSPQTEIIAMTTPGDMILLEFDEQENMTVHMQSVTSAPVARNKKVQLEAYDGENPFNDSDLPVDME